MIRKEREKTCLGYVMDYVKDMKCFDIYFDSSYVQMSECSYTMGSLYLEPNVGGMVE